MFSKHFRRDSESLILLFLEGHCTVGENTSCTLSDFSDCCSDGHRGDTKLASHSMKAKKNIVDPTGMRGRAKINSSPSFSAPSESSHSLVTPTMLSRTNAVMIAQNFFVLEKILWHHRSSSPNSCCTERSLYYRDPQLFAGGQKGVQRCLHRICRCLDVCRALQEAFESYVQQNEVKCLGNAWWERRMPSLWAWKSFTSGTGAARKLFTSSFSFSDVWSFTKPAEKLKKFKRQREGKDEEKSAVGRKEDHDAVLPCGIRTQDTFLSSPTVSQDEYGCSFLENMRCTHLVSALDAPVKRNTIHYCRERIGVIANGKSILVGYLAFEVEVDRPLSGSRAAVLFPTYANPSPSSRVLSGLSNGTQGMLLTSDVVLRSTHFRGLSLVDDPHPSVSVLFPLRNGDTVQPSTKRRSHHAVSQVDAPLCSFAASIPKSFPTFFSSQHILVIVEKECVLRTLLDTDHALLPSCSSAFRSETNSSYPHSVVSGSFSVSSFPLPLAAPDRRFIFLCTRGYPCVASRLFLRRLHAAWPSLPLVALTDGDPHGIAIVLSLMGLLCTPTSEAPLSASFFRHPRPTAEEILSCASLPSSAKRHVPATDGDVPFAFHVEHLLPLCWVGVMPSQRMREHHGKHTSSFRGAASYSASQPSEFIPITPSDTKVLSRLEKYVESYLHKNVSVSHTSNALHDSPPHRTLSPCTASVPHSLHTSPSSSAFEFPSTLPLELHNAITHHSLQCLLQEIRWIQKNAVKCEIEALHPETPLAFLQRSLSSFHTIIDTQ